MDNLINETNSRLQEIIDNLTTIKNEYETKLKNNSKEIEKEQEKVKKYKEEFFTSKEKIEKMNSDIEGFEEDYKNLVERFKDDELANILIAANKEISAKIDERKRKIVNDKQAMNELVLKAEKVKTKLVKLTAEKKAFELCLDKILDSYEYYSKVLGEIIEYSNANKNNLVPKEEKKVIEEEKLSDTTELNIDEMKKASEEEFMKDTAPLETEEDEEIIDVPTTDETIDNNFVIGAIEEDKDEDDSESIKLILENDNIELEDEETEDETEEEETDSIKLIQEIEQNEETNVTEISEIPSSLFNFDEVVAFDDGIEDE